MSEFHYYEFRTLDRRLTSEEIATVRNLSRSARVTDTRATFVYHYEDFNEDAQEILYQYFDVMLYTSNYGVKELYFKLPKNLANLKALNSYSIKNNCIVQIVSKKNFILVLLIVDMGDGEDDLIEEEDISLLLSELIPLREEILLEDYRVLFLTWIANYLDEGAQIIEGLPVPPNLHKLSPALKAFIKFFCIQKEHLEKFIKKSEKALLMKT